MNEAIRPYTERPARCRRCLVATGASVFGEAKQFPWTGGWQPVYDYEARIYGKAIAHNSPNAKIAVLYQNDRLRQGAPRRAQGGARGQGVEHRRVRVARGDRGRRPHPDREAPRDRAPSILVIFTTPRFTIQSYAIANALRWSPAVIYTTSVSATDTFLTLAKNSGGGDLPDRTYTVQYAKDPANTSWDNDAAMKLYKQVMAKYNPSASGHRRAQLLRRRDGARVRPAAVHGRQEPDARVAHARRTAPGTRPTRSSCRATGRRRAGGDQLPIQCERIIKFTNGDLPAGVEAQVRRRGDVVAGRSRRCRAAPPRGPPGTAPSTAPSSSGASTGARGRSPRR